MKYKIEPGGRVRMEPIEDSFGDRVDLSWVEPRGREEIFYVSIEDQTVALPRPQFEEFVEQAIWLRANADAVEKDGQEVKEWGEGL